MSWKNWMHKLNFSNIKFPTTQGTGFCLQSSKEIRACLTICEKWKPQKELLTTTTRNWKLLLAPINNIKEKKLWSMNYEGRKMVNSIWKCYKSFSDWSLRKSQERQTWAGISVFKINSKFNNFNKHATPQYLTQEAERWRNWPDIQVKSRSRF